MVKTLYKIMRTLKITIVLLAFTLSAFSQQAFKVTRIVKEFPAYSEQVNMWVPSKQQVKTTDSLKRIGFKPMGVSPSGHGTIIVTFFKPIK